MREKCGNNSLFFCQKREYVVTYNFFFLVREGMGKGGKGEES